MKMKNEKLQFDAVNTQSLKDTKKMLYFCKKKCRKMAKGRDIELIKKRDNALCRRWVYLSEVKRLRTDDVLRILSQDEFFLSEERIYCIIRNNQGIIKSLVDKQLKNIKHEKHA
jgi:hypothetical protein